MNLQVLLAEEAITQAMVDGTLPNVRLHAAVLELDRGSWAIALTDLREALTNRSGSSTREALTAVLDDLHVRRRLPVADLQILAIGFYRLIWRLLVRLDSAADVNDIRQLDAQKAARLCYGFTFGLHPQPFPLSGAMIARFRGRLATLFSTADSDHEWQERGPLPLGVPLIALSDRHLSPAANAIRNTFFFQVFIDTIGAERQTTLDPDGLVLDFLIDAAADPHLMPFLRHATPAQGRFRLTQLTQALIALHQIEVNQSTSAGQPYTIPFAEAAIGCLLSPFVSLRSWLRVNRGRLLIPVIRQMPDDDALIIHRPAITIPPPEPARVPALRQTAFATCHPHPPASRITT